MATPQRIYPVGEQDFENVRERNCIYVDKTDLIYNLTHGSTRYVFLSRPRRFGKSLLCSTMKAYFEGRKELFHGLAMEKLETEWTPRPVLHIDMSGDKYTDEKKLNTQINVTISQWEKIYGKDNSEDSFAARFAGVIQRACEQTGQKAVVIIDEYDAPLLDTNSNPELQKKLRGIVRGFYSPLKKQSKYLHFVFLTGITKFSQLSIFSELNNLENISMSDTYSALCGISKEELLTQMRPDIELLAEANNETFEEACDHLRRKYDGYHFSKNSKDVYNPFSLVRAFYNKEYGNYWFSSGTPTFLIDLLKESHFDINKLEKMTSAAEEFDQPTDHINNPVAVLYQSGYLTIKSYDKELDLYTLGYPNNEVRYGFLRALVPNYILPKPTYEGEFLITNFKTDLASGNIEDCLERMRAFFAAVPFDLNNKTEKHYQTLFYAIFTLLGERIRVEYHTATGSADAVVWMPKFIYVFEFKYEGTAEEALAQINARGYTEPFAADGRKVFKVGVNFDGATRTIADWKIEET